MSAPELSYRHGLAIIRHVREAPPGTQYDPRLEAWVAPGHRLASLRKWAHENGVRDDTIRQPLSAPDDAPLFDPRIPREYQQTAVDRWLAGGARGSVVLPTGAGKSFVAVLAIHATSHHACVIAPTRALVAQWYSQLVDAFGTESVGAWYGDEKNLADITVTTYHSAFALLERHGARFDLLVLDEAHHLADGADGAPKAWHDAIRIAPAPRRLALTATYPDGADRALCELVGPVVYRRTIAEMADAELAAFAVERRYVSFDAEERAQYDNLNATYRSFVEQRGYRERFEDRTTAWKVFVAEARRSPAARRALHAFRQRETMITLPASKLRETERLLRLFPAESALIFCGDTQSAERVSRHFAIPMITSNTPASERKHLLDQISNGDIHAIASVRVLDEGWDVPSAKLGIVLADSTRGSPRQHAQRLGRILRRQGDRVASLFELVVSDTHEFYTAQKRQRGARPGVPQLGLGF